MKLLLINSFKGLKKKKIQMFSIAFLVMLSMAIYVGISTAIDRLETRYYDYLEEQKVEHLSLDVQVDYQKDVTSEQLQSFMEDKAIDANDMAILKQYASYLEEDNYKYNLVLFTEIKKVFQKYGFENKIKELKLEKVQNKYDFDYELQRSKTVTEQQFMMKVIPFSKSKKLNIPYLVEGKFPEKENEITVLPGFAKANHLHIGDSYEIGEQKYTIVGFAFAPDYIYPLISFSVPFFDEKKNNVIFMKEEDYQKIRGVDDDCFSLYYRHPTTRSFTTLAFDENSEANKMFQAERETFAMTPNSALRIARVGLLQTEFASNRLFADCFLYLLLGISVMIIIIITKKRIEDERLQIGVLKSLGYNRFAIAASYLVYPIVGSLIGGILGFGIGIGIHYPMANLFLSFYNVPLKEYALTLKYLGFSVLVPLLILSFLSYLIAFVMLRKKPLQLLKEGSNLKVNLVTKFFNKITSFMPFTYRFKYSLASRSFGKLFLVMITSFGTGLLIVLILIGSNLFQNMIDQSFSGMHYQYAIQTKNVLYADQNSSTDDYLLNVSLPVTKIESKGQNKTWDDESLTITGLDQDTKYLELLDENSKNIVSVLQRKNTIIMNENAKEQYHLEIGDKLILEHENIHLVYEIVGFNKEYMGIAGYVDRNQLSKNLGLPQSGYNGMYSTNPKYKRLNNLGQEEANSIAYIMNIDDMKENISKQMDRFNGVVYVIIIFAAIMVFVIIAVIANIVVEENRKTISLMKVLGYKDRKIGNIVLNIYTPFIILSYLLSIPVMVGILKMILKAIIGDIGITIPVSLSPWLALLGLISLVVAYYIAVFISKRSLKKVPLAVALKRE